MSRAVPPAKINRAGQSGILIKPNVDSSILQLNIASKDACQKRRPKKARAIRSAKTSIKPWVRGPTRV